jgi:hypothetical protein
VHACKPDKNKALVVSDGRWTGALRTQAGLERKLVIIQAQYGALSEIFSHGLII